MVERDTVDEDTLARRNATDDTEACGESCSWRETGEHRVILAAGEGFGRTDSSEVEIEVTRAFWHSSWSRPSALCSAATIPVGGRPCNCWTDSSNESINS